MQQSQHSRQIIYYVGGLHVFQKLQAVLISTQHYVFVVFWPKTITNEKLGVDQKAKVAVNRAHIPEG